ncbi:MAG: VTT domain-containing protein [Minicystis sp.]
MRRLVRFLPVLAVLALPLAATQLPPVRAAIFALLELMREGRPAGVLAYVAAYALGSIFTAPIALFSGIAGYVYGPVKGFLLASPAVTIAAATAFLVGRFVLHDRVARLTADNERFEAIQRAVAAHPFKIAVLLRMTPIAPQNFLSYALSLTRMRLTTFMAATWVGLLPVTAFQAYVGSLVHDAAELLDGKRPPLGPWGWAATVAGLVLTVAAMLLIAKLARRALAKSGV